MASVIRSLGITGISGYPLMVEVAIIAGLQTTNIVGLGDSAIKEAKDRMEACTEEMGYAYPTRKVVVNLSPSDIKKRGAYLDLPMLIGMLVESGQVKPRKKGWDEIAFVGGISTTGTLVDMACWPVESVTIAATSTALPRPRRAGSRKTRKSRASSVPMRLQAVLPLVRSTKVTDAGSLPGTLASAR